MLKPIDSVRHTLGDYISRMLPLASRNTIDLSASSGLSTTTREMMSRPGFSEESKTTTNGPVIKLKSLVLCMLAVLCGASFCFGQTNGGSSTAHPLITKEITAEMQTLKGHVRPQTGIAQDLGAVDDALPLNLHLVLQRSPEQEADLQNLIARQQQAGAEEYHQWLTPQQFGQRFGASQQDITKLTTWLQSRGLQVNGVSNSATFIHFSATAGQIRQVFGTQLHNFSLKDGVYPAAMNDPEIPASLAPAVASIQGLTKFPLRSHVKNPRQVSYNAVTHSWDNVGTSNVAKASPEYNAGSGDYNVTPQDLYTIYDVNKVLSPSGLNDLGANSTIAVIEQSDMEFGMVDATTGVATGGDVTTFRSLFGVPGTLNMHVYHGYGSVTCNAPGIDPVNAGEDYEAALDAEWASALAPSANLIFMSCDQNVNQGINTSLMAVIDNNLADVISTSYGASEISFAPSDYVFQDNLYSQAATQGQSVLVSSGDSGSDLADQNQTYATYGINVNGFSASPLVTSTGGTDFSDRYDSRLGGPPQSTYWGATNSNYYGDALSYVPETAWNDTCASSLVDAIPGLYCGGQFALSQPIAGGSGGFSTHYEVPAYQSGILGYSGTMRAQPDISGFAGDGFYGHILMFCDSYRPNFACSSSSTLGGSGGTSFVAPYMAGVVGLLDAYTGQRQGVLNPTLYALAKGQFTASSTKSSCYANGQTANTGVTSGLPASTCIFHDVTTGNNDVPCGVGSTNCYVDASGHYGILSLTGSAPVTVAFPSTTGYDEATGIGTVDVYNLLTNWSSAFTSSVSLTATASTLAPTDIETLSATVAGSVPVGYSITVPAITGSVAFQSGTTGIGSCTLASSTCSIRVSASSLSVGSNSITATYSGNPIYPSSTSSVQNVFVLSSQTIYFEPISPQTVGQTVGLGAAASSGLAVTFSASPSTVCSVSGISASFSGPGQCSITASQAGNATYAATAVTQTFTVFLPQNIIFPSISQQTVGTPLTITAFATSGLAVSYSSSSPSFVCSITGSAVSFSAPGTCTITASQAGNATYAAATPITQTFNVVGEPQTITFGPIPTQTVGTPLTLTATASSGLAVSYTASPSTVCAVSGSRASFSGTGNCTIMASQFGNATYASASSALTFPVVAMQTITFQPISSQTSPGTASLNATASSGLPVSYSASPSTVCSVTGSTASFAAPGQCSITASQAGNVTYAPASSVTQTFTVFASQSILFATIPTQSVGTKLTLTASANSGLPVSYSSSSPSFVCSITGSTVSFSATGTCTITASQAGNSTYAPASVTQTFDVYLASQTITFASIPPQTIGTTLVLTATASSGLPVSYSASPSTVCSVNGSTASFSTIGTCNITASQSGNNSTYQSANPVTLSFNVVESQTVTFGPISPQAVNTTLTLSATASSGLPVSFVASPSTVCAVSGSTVSFSAPGQCSITAAQAGDATYRSASVTLTVPVAALVANICPGGIATPSCTQNYHQLFTIGSNVTLGTPLVFTGGAQNLDFTLGSGSTCTGAVTAGSTCTVNVNFSPQLPGLRKGAIQLMDNSGNIIATTFISAIGVGPQVTFPSNSNINTVGSGFIGPNGMAVDASGNVFVADYLYGAVWEIVAQDGVVSSSSTVISVGSGFTSPQGVAVDASGNVFVTDSGQVMEIVAQNGTVSTSSQVVPVGSGFASPVAIALDGNGNVFVADFNNGAGGSVYQILAMNGVVTSSSSVIPVGSGFNGPFGVAVDGSGNVFVADAFNKTVQEIVAVNGAVSASSAVNTLPGSYAAPTGVAVDNSGNVYVVDNGTGSQITANPSIGGVYEIVAVNGAVSSSSSVIPVGSGFNGPFGVALDSRGNIFVADQANSLVKEIDRADAPTLTFATTNVGSQSTAQSVTIQNIGNAPLTTTSLVESANFAQVAGSGSPADCPAGAGTLAAGATCNISLVFAPVTGGSVTGASTLTNNNLNVTGATQNIALSGTSPQATQTITFAPIPMQTVGTPLTPLSAQSTSGTVVSFASTTPLVCTVAGSSVTFLAAGTCTITGSVPANGAYAAASASVSFSVQLATQTITFNQPASQTVGTPLTLAATSTSTVPINYSSSTAAVCTVSGNSVTFLTAGTCTITASQSATAAYAAASVTQSFPVLANQTITFGTIGTQVAGTTLPLVATASSKLLVSFVSNTTAVCTVLGTTATFVAAGTCSITASQAGDSVTYLAAPSVTQSFTVLGTQTITFANPGTQLAGTTLSLTASASSGLAVSYSASGAGCSVSGNTATFSAPGGSCTITASQPGNSTGFAAAPSVSQTFTVNVTPTISWPQIGTQTLGGTVTLSATSNSPGALTYSSSTPSVCTVSGATAKLLIAGICTLNVSQAASGNYTAATAQNTFGVGAGMQSITWAPIASQAPGTSISLSATASSGLAVSFASSTTSVCTVTGTTTFTANFLTNGACTITATQAGNANYKAATPVTQNITVNKTTQTLTFAAIATGTVGGSVSLSATASSGLTPVTFVSSTPAVCTVSAATATLVGSGTCSITATQAGNATYAAASAMQAFTVVGKPQAVTFTTITAKNVNTTVALKATASSGLPVTIFTSSTPSVCTVTGTTASLIAGGQCSITATQSGNSIWAEATASQTFTVNTLAQSITFNAIPEQTVNATVPLSATASSGLLVTFSSLTPTVCTVSGTTATPIAQGECEIQALQAGSSIYTVDSVVRQFKVDGLVQTITLGPIANQTAGTSFTLAATSSSNLAVSYTALPAGVCSVSGSTVSNLAGGTCKIMATQAGNTVYKPAAPVLQSFTIAKIAQTITFGALATQTVGATVGLAATSNSELAVTYVAGPAGVCSVSGNTLTTIAGGTCKVVANQPGNAVYSAAAPVAQSFTVNKLAQTITFSAIATQKVGVPLSLSATASSGLTVKYSATPAKVCSVSGTTVTLLAAGNCTMTAAQPGDGAYSAAAAVQQTFVVTN